MSEFRRDPRSTSLPHVLYPRALASGDLIAIAAPSGPLRPGDESSLARGVEMIESMGFRVRLAPLVDTSRRRWWAAGIPKGLESVDGCPIPV
jgi:muramoyltetrapeptide carboxypeptidase